MSGAAAGLGEFRMTGDDGRRIAAILREEAGIVLDASKSNLIYSRLARRLRLLGMRRFTEYCELIERPAERAEREAMVAALTTNTTRFFREPHHFRHLQTVILPPLLDRARQGEKIRLWSAGCSSGQEPYSMALSVLALLPDAARYDIRILATDIDENMIEAGIAGRYDRALMADVPVALASRWFEAATADRFDIGADLRAMVRFKKLNLIGHWPMRALFDAIFCRNVVIYFDEATKDQIWKRMVHLLQPGGALYIGHSERIGGGAEEKLRSDGVTTYRPRAAAAAARAACA